MFACRRRWCEALYIRSFKLFCRRIQNKLRAQIVKNLRLGNMQTYDLHEARIHLSRLVDEAANGKSFFISKAGKPVVKVVPFNSPEANQAKRLGFMAGQISVPDDFDRMHIAEIQVLVGGK
jgi:prevent-host-death family protein